MALRIQSRSWKNQDGSISKSWRLIVEDFTSGERVSFYPKRVDYPRYGLVAEDSFERAQQKLKVAQAKNKIEKTAERRSRIEKRLNEEDLKESAYLPREIYRDYLTWLQDRRLWTQIPSKTESHLRCMRRLIMELGLDPSEWPNRPEKIYRWFLTNKYSISYIEKVLPLLNAYGYFYCSTFKRPFLEVPRPPADLAIKIEDANLVERDGRQEESDPLTPALLARLAGWPEGKYRWMRISMYFGLRPSEIDGLVPEGLSKAWSIHKDKRGTLVLAVYQPKLRVSRPRRWKRIPCILKEQVELVGEIKDARPIERPYCTTLQKYLGDSYGLYAGRKGFEGYMRDEVGQSFINISRWLGHRDLTRTESHYREIEAVEYDLP